MKKIQKNLAVLLSAFQVFGLKYSARGMLSNLGSVAGAKAVDKLFDKLDISDEDVKKVKNKVLSILSVGYVELSDEELAALDNERLHPTKENRLLKLQYIRSTREIYENTYDMLMQMGIPENSMLGDIRNFKSWDSISVTDPRQKDRIARSMAYVRVFAKQQTMEAATSISNTVGTKVLEFIGFLGTELIVISLFIQAVMKVMERYFEHWNKSKDQKEYDNLQRKQYGDSAIDYNKDWLDINKGIVNLANASLHNYNEIMRMKELIHGFYVAHKIKFEQNIKKQNANNAEINKKINKKSKSNCLIISISGDPGSGKTSFARAFAKLAGADSPTVISLNSFDKENKNLSVAQQVNGMWWMGSQERGHFEYGPIVSTFKHNLGPMRAPVIIIDEFDKSPDALIDMLWDASDSGSFNIAGKQVECDGAIIFLIQNSKLSDRKSLSEGKNQKLEALLGRVEQFNFCASSKESYENALKIMLEKLTPELEENYEIKFKWDIKALNFLVEKCIKDNKAMRSIETCKNLVVSVVDSALNADEEEKNKEINGNKKISVLELSCDEAASRLFCKKIFGVSDKKLDKLKSLKSASQTDLKKYDNKNDENNIKKISKIVNEIFDDIYLTNIPDSIDCESVLDESDLKFLKSLILMIDPKVQIFNVNEQLNFVLKNKEKIKENMIHDGITDEQVKKAKSLKFKINSILNKDSNENIDNDDNEDAVKDVSVPTRIKIEDNREGIKT